MTLKLLAAGAAVALAPAIAAAEAHESCPMTYETFEFSVPHTDLQDCPASMEVEDAFCRVAIMAEVATVFAFSEDTSCIVASRPYYDEEFGLTIR